MKRDERLVRLSWDHHHGLVMALKIERGLAVAGNEAVASLYSELLAFWAAGLLPHFRVEQECLLARLFRHVGGGHEAIQQTEADHLEMESLVATMRDSDDIAVRRAALAHFGERLRTHIRWEEATLFELTQEQLTDQEMDSLRAEIDDALGEVVPSPGA